MSAQLGEMVDAGLIPAAAEPHRTISPFTQRRSIAMVTICALAMFLNNGFMFIGVSVFDPIMIRRLGISVGTLKVGDTITMATIASTAALAGYLIDRFGPRLLFAVGMVLMSVGMLFYSFVVSIAQIYLIHILFGLCIVLSGAFICLVVVSAATSRHRGLAIGSLLAAASLGMGIAPAVMSMLEAAIGWQATLRLVAAVTLLLLPAILLVIPGRAAQDAIDHGQGALGNALRAKNFWLLAAVAALGYLTAIGTMSNMVLYLTRELRVSGTQVGTMGFTLFSTILVMQLVTGILVDRLNSRIVHVVCILTMAIGCLLLGLHPPGTAWIALILFGIGWGGNYTLLQYLATHLFSGPAIGRIVGMIGMIEAVGGALGPVTIGASYDHARSYGPVFIILSVALLAMALLASRIRKDGRSEAAL
jgi:MFS family permease